MERQQLIALSLQPQPHCLLVNLLSSVPPLLFRERDKQFGVGEMGGLTNTGTDPFLKRNENGCIRAVLLLTAWITTATSTTMTQTQCAAYQSGSRSQIPLPACLQDEDGVNDLESGLCVCPIRRQFLANDWGGGWLRASSGVRCSGCERLVGVRVRLVTGMMEMMMRRMASSVTGGHEKELVRR